MYLQIVAMLLVGLSIMLFFLDAFVQDGFIVHGKLRGIVQVTNAMMIAVCATWRLNISWQTLVQCGAMVFFAGSTPLAVKAV